MQFMNEQDAPNGNQAECYVTINDKVYPAMFAKDFKANMNIKTKEVPVLGKNIMGHKVQNAALSFEMTIYKCTEIFDDVVEEFKNTGMMPLFDIQVTQYDKATSIGRSTKIYKDCVLDGDVLLSAFNTQGEFIEQTVKGYCADYEAPEKYTNPSYMG